MGTLGAPDDPSSHLRLRIAKMTIFVHRDLREEAADEGELRFHFGRFGWCRIRLSRAARKILQGEAC